MMDWTYDKYLEDVKQYGIEDEKSDNYNAYFIATVKKWVAEFLAKWNEEHNGKLYDQGWAGDKFAENMLDWFSDFYKDAYGQRPHLPIWYYVHPLGLPMQEDTSRLFCDDPIGRAVEDAKETRERF